MAPYSGEVISEQIALLSLSPCISHRQRWQINKGIASQAGPSQSSIERAKRLHAAQFVSTKRTRSFRSAGYKIGSTIRSSNTRKFRQQIGAGIDEHSHPSITCI